MNPPASTEDQLDNRRTAAEDDQLAEDEWTEADFLDEEEGEQEPPVYQIWMRRTMLALVAVALVGNLFASIPLIFNLNVIQFLKKTSELSQMAELQAYKQAIVIVKTADSKGTGFNIDPGGVIITNAHVVDASATAVVGFEDGRTFHARVIERDDEHDLAVLRLNEPPDSPLPLLELEERPVYAKGEQIYYIGNPYFFNHIIGEGSIYSMIEISGRASPVLALLAPIYKGNSGSPVINEAGKVIAVVYATSSIPSGNDKQKVGLAVPIEQLQRIWPR